MQVSAITQAASSAGHRSPLLRLQSDERLIVLIRRGNQRAFEALVSRYQSRLLAFCRHMLSSREDSEDVLQEVFAAAYKAILADDRELNVRPWLYRIARNRSLNHLRKAKAVGVDSMDIHLSENGETTADKVDKREQFRELISDVSELPETQRTALLLREIDALSYDQIAQAMETTIPAIKSLLVRARVGLAEAAEARQITCEEVRDELGAVAEGLRRTSPPVRRHLRTCERCETFKKQLRQTNRALAAVFPIGPLLLLKKVLLDAGGAAASGGAAAGAPAAASSAIAGGAIASKCAAGLAAVTIVGAGVVEVRNPPEPVEGTKVEHSAKAAPAAVAAAAPEPLAVASTPQPPTEPPTAVAAEEPAHKKSKRERKSDDRKKRKGAPTATPTPRPGTTPTPGPASPETPGPPGGVPPVPGASPAAPTTIEQEPQPPHIEQRDGDTVVLPGRKPPPNRSPEPTPAPPPPAPTPAPANPQKHEPTPESPPPNPTPPPATPSLSPQMMPAPPPDATPEPTPATPAENAPQLPAAG